MKYLTEVGQMALSKKTILKMHKCWVVRNILELMHNRNNAGGTVSALMYSQNHNTIRCDAREPTHI